MRARQQRIAALTVELAPVYRAGTTGRRFLTRAAAYRRAAVEAVAAAYPCQCDSPDMSIGYAGHFCGWHPGEPHFDKLVSRLARWLRWRDGRAAALRSGG